MLKVSRAEKSYAVQCNLILPVSTLAKLILFADDTSLFFSHRDPVYLVNMINQELEKVSICLRTNRYL